MRTVQHRRCGICGEQFLAGEQQCQYVDGVTDELRAAHYLCIRQEIEREGIVAVDQDGERFLVQIEQPDVDHEPTDVKGERSEA